MASRIAAILTCWFLANLLGVGLLTFAETLPLRMVGVVWVATALTVSGIVSVGGLLSLSGSDAKTTS